MTQRPTRVAFLPKLSAVLLVILLVAASLILVAGRDLSHRLTVATCTNAGDCGTFPDSPPVCEYYGRDRVMARESFAFAQQQAALGARLVQFGDDSAEVLVDDGDGSWDVYNFLHWEDAQKWMLDHSTELGQVANAAAGPSGQPIRDGYLRMLQLTGLDHETAGKPESSATPVEEPSGSGTHGVLRHDSDGQISEVAVVIPLDSASAELKTFAAELGLWEFFSYTIELDSNLEPRSLTLGGPAAEGWSLHLLQGPAARRSAEPAQDVPSYVTDDQAVLRSFVLDLTKQANAALYRDIFAMESLAGTAVPLLTAEDWLSAGERDERYTRILDRISKDAVAVENTQSFLDGGGDEEHALQAVEGLVIQAGSGSLPETRLLDARSADLAISGSSLDPLLTCDVDDDGAGGAGT